MIHLPRRHGRQLVGLRGTGSHPPGAVSADPSRPPLLIGIIGRPLSREILIETTLRFAQPRLAGAGHRPRLLGPLVLQAALGFPQPLPPAVVARDLQRCPILTVLVLTIVLGLIGLLVLGEQLASDLLIVEVREPARVRLHLRAVQRDHADLRQPRLGAQPEHLEQAGDRVLASGAF